MLNVARPEGEREKKERDLKESAATSIQERNSDFNTSKFPTRPR